MNKDMYKKIALLLYSAALSWLLYVAFPGKGGTIFGILLFTISVCVLVWEKKVWERIPNRPKESVMPLFQIVVLVAVPICLIIYGKPKSLIPTYALGLAGSLFYLIYWIKDVDRKGYSLKQFVSDELRFPPGIDICTIILLVVLLVRGVIAFNWLTGAIMLVLLVDFVRQFGKLKRKEESEW